MPRLYAKEGRGRLKQEKIAQGGGHFYSFDQEGLIEWFIENKREFPWRQEVSPYAVWVSEVMLQQTQASVVQEYFVRWMHRFPTLLTLADASLEEVIKMWEGLGYYSRARNLYEGARYVKERYAGQLPQTYEELLSIKGLGPYTAGAILSFAFKKKKAALDGNGIRVLSRYFAIQEDIQRPATLKMLRAIAEAILPEEEPWLLVEGLIELGAIVCKKEPRCLECPLHATCLGRQQGVAPLLPKKGKKEVITPLIRSVFILYCQDKVLIKREETKRVMAGLYQFPFLEGKHLHPPFAGQATLQEHLPPVVHHFTRFKATLYPSLWHLDEPVDLASYQWVDIATLPSYPFSAGHRKLSQYIHARFTH